MLGLEIEDDRRAIAGSGFALVFDRVGDRWTHAIEVSRSPDSPRDPIAGAVEWDSDRDDSNRVVSPVYQDLQFQFDLQGRPQALLIGMSGRHHFSAVFTVAETPHGVQVVVEVADRCSDPVAFWASTYRVMLTSGALIDAGPTLIRWNLDSHELSFSRGRGTSVGLAEAGRGSTLVQATPVEDQDRPPSKTRSWNYVWTYFNTVARV